MSMLPEAAKYNNRILKILRTSSIANDELMAVTRQLDKLTALALRAANAEVSNAHLRKFLTEYDLKHESTTKDVPFD